MLRKRGQAGHIKRPPYRDTYHLPGTHNQAWSPDEVYYWTPPKRGSGGGANLQGPIQSLETKTSGPFAGLIAATVFVEVAPCDRPELLGTTVEVIDHSLCVFDLPEADLLDIWCFSSEGVAVDKEDPTKITECHWVADDRCCAPADEV